LTIKEKILMSYLNPLRFHFAGKFQADVSTVNNDVRHFDNATFKPEYQERQEGQHLNGWWNPEGTGAWRLVDCKVTQAFGQDGNPVDDPIVGMNIAGADQRVAGKLVDLDPEQQLVSQIWGLIVRLADGGTNLIKGDYKVAPFSDIWWTRAQDRSGGDNAASAMYQSVIENIQWGDVSHSPFLRQLKDAVGTNGLSIKFNVDGFNMDYQSPDFTLGRIVGTIGPALTDEPNHFVIGRQFMPELDTSGRPANNIFYASAVLDIQRKKIIADFGNALPTAVAGKQLANIGPLKLSYILPGNTLREIDDFPNYTATDWYEKTAGVIEFPQQRELTQQELDDLSKNQLTVLGFNTDTSSWEPLINESANGIYIRADEFVYRLNPGDQATVKLYATQYGQLLENAHIVCDFNNTILNAQVSPGDPAIGTPSTALKFDKHLVTGTNGQAALTLTASDPNNPRGYIDGQVYGVGYTLQSVLDLPYGAYTPNSSNFVSVLVWDHVEVPRDITWENDIKPIFQQYANLYPLMDKLVNLADYDAVVQHREILCFAFALNRENPNYMPVTRDLSDNKMEMVLTWLSQDVPPRGDIVTTTEITTAPPSEKTTIDVAKVGGKTMARHRKQGLPEELKAETQTSD
jgi:hypothetical protein